MKILLFLIIYCSLLIPSMRDCYGQSITWQKVLNNNYGSGQKIQQTNDLGYIVVGNERVNNQNKIYLVKLDYLGNVTWTKIIGIGENQGNWVEQTTDGGYIIGGATDSNFFSMRAYLLKTDSFGDVQWQKLYQNSDLDQCYCVKQTAEGGYILACRTTPGPAGDNAIMFIKTDAYGNSQWQKIYSSPGNQVFASELAILNYGYITVGRFIDGDNIDVYAIKLKPDGDSLWAKKYGGSNIDDGHSIDKIGLTGFMIAGYSMSFNVSNKSESYLCRIDTNGNQIWQRTYSNIGVENSNTVRFLDGKGFVLGGISDSLGNLVYKAKIRMFDLNGNPILETSYLPSPDYAFFNSMELTNDNGFIFAGGAAYASNLIRMYIVKTDSLLHSAPIGLVAINNNIPKQYLLYQNYPNPFNPTTKIKFDIPNDSKGSSAVKLVVINVLGQEITNLIDTDLNQGTYEIDFTARDLASGIYLCRLITKNYTLTKKMLLLK
ncbi:MAG: T9SS type A sorting domain-containing protein [Ignavibacteria bacterium]|nr:T9SS type A sorting domain-containing protein [Ignavibacteria bacterium]